MRYKIASIHGRFQPFHLAHFRYLQLALEQAENIYIGLTKILTEQKVGLETAPHRQNLDSNPLTYFERTSLIKSIMLAEGIDINRVEIGPFPIENPARLPEFWPQELVCFTTNVSAWNEEKIQTLREIGYTVEILELGNQQLFMSGTEIRTLIKKGDDRWKEFVPPHSGHLIEQSVKSALKSRS